ncbi:MAG: hypothetical protein KAR31_07650 [Candidatus Omnitrophica bacterium]|nr:hypothetical protein [Candidatus Omnitrophota bacterium]MCK5180293.1 hypothetical protein [Candidatus Omnitrophota bacterium]MCK5259719.1 hypothetical protein [Candidatus Omnitrophota bacterium]
MIRKQIEKDVSRGGQSIVEYIILMAVVIAFLVIFLGSGGYFEQVYNRTIQQQGDDMLDAAITIFN